MHSHRDQTLRKLASLSPSSPRLCCRARARSLSAREREEGDPCSAELVFNTARNSRSSFSGLATTTNASSSSDVTTQADKDSDEASPTTKRLRSATASDVKDGGEAVSGEEAAVEAGDSGDGEKERATKARKGKRVRMSESAPTVIIFEEATEGDEKRFSSLSSSSSTTTVIPMLRSSIFFSTLITSFKNLSLSIWFSVSLSFRQSISHLFISLSSC